MERVADAFYVGRRLSLHTPSDGDPGTSACGTERRCVHGVRFALLNVERRARDREGNFAMLKLDREPLRDFHVVLGGA